MRLAKGRAARAPWCRRPARSTGSRKSTSRLTCSTPPAAPTLSITRRSGTATPNSSIRRMSTTLTPRARRSSRSPRSIERMPNRWRLFGRDGRARLVAEHLPRDPGSPASSAADMPCMLPDGVVVGVLKSACASSHSTNSGAPASCAWRATPVDRSHREAVIAAEHDRKGALVRDGVGALAQGARPRRDLGEVAGLIGGRRRFERDRRRRHHVAEIFDDVPELAQAVEEPGDPQGRRPHDRAGLARADIDRRAEDRDALVFADWVAGGRHADSLARSLAGRNETGGAPPPMIAGRATRRNRRGALVIPGRGNCVRRSARPLPLAGRARVGVPAPHR